MSYGMDKTAFKKRRELQKKYIPNASDKVGDSLKSEARKAEKQKRDDKYNEYLKLSKNAYEFAKNNLSNQKFNENWLKIFHKFLDE